VVLTITAAMTAVMIVTVVMIVVMIVVVGPARLRVMRIAVGHLRRGGITRIEGLQGTMFDEAAMITAPEALTLTMIVDPMGIAGPRVTTTTDATIGGGMNAMMIGHPGQRMAMEDGPAKPDSKGYIHGRPEDRG
jgi:hypothetical protein